MHPHSSAIQGGMSGLPRVVGKNDSGRRDDVTSFLFVGAEQQ